LRACFCVQNCSEGRLRRDLRRTIFLTEIDGKWYEFGYYEYTGKNFEADMVELAKEPRNIEWLKTCDPMQIPLTGEKGWRVMEQVYLNE